jgi:hypothetical protein
MTKKLEELLNITPAEEAPLEMPAAEVMPTHVDLQQNLEQFD